MKKKHGLILDTKQWDKVQELSKFYGHNTNTGLINGLIDIAYEMMTKNQRTINSIGNLEKLMFDQIKQIDNQTKMMETVLMNLTLLSVYFNKTDKKFHDLTWDDVKENKHEIIKMFSKSK